MAQANANKLMFNVKNRSASRVVYTILEDGIRREFAPGETKKISYNELAKLAFQPGGQQMMVNFLQIQSDKAVKSFGIAAQPEYFMSEQQIVKLLKDGSLDEFLDCLDFAPIGVTDLIKKIAVDMPLSDYAKKRALKDKFGFDVDAALKHKEEDSEDESLFKEVTTERRVKPQNSTGRRTNVNYAEETLEESVDEEQSAGSKYKIVE